MKIYYVAILWLAISISVYGVAIPFLVSYPDDILVVAGVGLGVFTAPIEVKLGIKIFKQIKGRFFDEEN